MVLIWFLYLCTWKTRILCLKLCCFYKTKEEKLKLAALMAKCLGNNLWKFHQKILNYSENNEIFVRGCFFGRTRYISFLSCYCGSVSDHQVLLLLINLIWFDLKPDLQTPLNQFSAGWCKLKFPSIAISVTTQLCDLVGVDSWFTCCSWMSHSFIF